MPTVTEPLRGEHRHLLPHIEKVREVADAIGEASIDHVRTGVDDVYTFLTRHLIPHAEAEDEALYPVVGRLMGAPEATATMSRDHVEVGRLTAELAALREELPKAGVRGPVARELRRVLYGLYALVKVHLAKEEEVYLPILEAGLTADDAAKMFCAMLAAEREV